MKKLYKYIFWAGYIAVLITTFIPISGSLNKVKLGPESFHIRLDQLLHFMVYFLICMYFLAGQQKGYPLFSENSLTKFTLVVFLLAIVTEWVQLFVPDRAFNVFDLISNVTGVFLGMGILMLAQRRKDKEAQRRNDLQFKGIMVKMH